MITWFSDFYKAVTHANEIMVFLWSSRDCKFSVEISRRLYKIVMEWWAPACGLRKYNHILNYKLRFLWLPRVLDLLIRQWAFNAMHGTRQMGTLFCWTPYLHLAISHVYHKALPHLQHFPVSFVIYQQFFHSIATSRCNSLSNYIYIYTVYIYIYM